jgi:hypothetical protein
MLARQLECMFNENLEYYELEVLNEIVYILTCFPKSKPYFI